MNARWALVCLAAIVGLALVLRLVDVGQPLWLDELHSSWVVAEDWQDVAPRAAEGNHGPLYFWLLRGWTDLASGLGSSQPELLFRLPSLVAGLLLVAAAYATAARIGARFGARREIGLLAAALVAVDRDCIFYSQEARPYALVQLVAVVHLLVVWQVTRRPTMRWRLALVAGIPLLFYLHYTALLFVLAECLFLLFVAFSSRQPRYRIGMMVLDLGLGLAACLPATARLLTIAGHRGDWAPYVRGATSWRWLATTFRLQLYLGLPLLAHVIQSARFRWGWARWGWRRRPMPLLGRRGARLRRLALPLVTALVPIVLVWLAGHLGIPLGLSRYVVASGAALIVLAALTCMYLRGNAARTIAAAALVIAIVVRGGLVQQWMHDGRLITDRNEDWPAAIDWINAGRSDQEPILLSVAILEDAHLRERDDQQLRHYCRFPLRGVYSVRIADRLLCPLPTLGTNRLDAPALGRLRAAGGGWWLIRGDAAFVDVVLRDGLRQLRSRGNQARITDRRQFGGLGVVKLEVK